MYLAAKGPIHDIRASPMFNVLRAKLRLQIAKEETMILSYGWQGSLCPSCSSLFLISFMMYKIKLTLVTGPLFCMRSLPMLIKRKWKRTYPYERHESNRKYVIRSTRIREKPWVDWSRLQQLFRILHPWQNCRKIQRLVRSTYILLTIHLVPRENFVECFIWNIKRDFF